MPRDELDLTPDPRVLQMLGEIDLHQWRCLAELIDNSIDGFLHASRAGNAIEHAEIAVAVPNANNEAALGSCSYCQRQRPRPKSCR